MTDRTFSMRAGLAASTVTPGSTAPEASRTTPAIAPLVAVCADAAAGANATHASTATIAPTVVARIAFHVLMFGLLDGRTLPETARAACIGTAAAQGEP